MSKRLRRPSPALVIALIALFAALSGAAIALPGKNTVDSGDVKKNTLKGKDIKESTLVLPSNAISGPQVTAYAKVTDTGTVQAQQGVTSVTKVSTGRYCFDLASAAAAGTATPANTGVAFGTGAYVDVPAVNAACTAPNNDAEVVTGTTAFKDTPFYVTFVK